MLFDTLRRWLNPPTEKRAGYTDVLTQAIIAQANLGTALYSGAMEIAAGTYARALASAVSSGRDARLFNATVMGEIGRDLIEGGKSVWLVGENTLRHVPALDIEHPGRTLHLRYSTDVHSGRGIGPLGKWMSMT